MAKTKAKILTAKTEIGANKPETKFPRISLEEALKVPLAIKEHNAGNPWPTEEVAKAVSLSRKANSFFYLTAASRDFGLTTGSRDTERIELAPLGRELVYAPDAETEAQKKREAFLRIPIFRKVLDYYKGSDLLEMKYLGNTLESEFSLPVSAHEDFSRLFRENCDYLQIKSGFHSEAAEGSAVGGSLASSPVTVTLAEPTAGKGPVAFVIMPFQEREESRPAGFFQEALRSLITPAASNAGFTVRTANRQGSDLIQSTIVKELLEADLVIADLTEHNPNVLFELGVRVAKEKPVALIKAAGTGRLFDVDNMLRVYEYQPQLWRTTLEKDLPALSEHVRATWDNRATDPNYMKILQPTAAVDREIKGN